MHSGRLCDFDVAFESHCSFLLKIGFVSVAAQDRCPVQIAYFHFVLYTILGSDGTKNSVKTLTNLLFYFSRMERKVKIERFA